MLVAVELAVEAFEEAVDDVDRLKARAYAIPTLALGDVGELRPPIGELHPLRIAEAVARFGGRPADAASIEQHEEAVLAVLDPTPEVARPHEEADPSLRVARRILQRLMGMGKWGGYHTEIAHLARGFAGHDRALALAIGERLVERRPARGEDERPPAPRAPQPAPRRRDPRARRPRRAAAGTRAAVTGGR